MSFVLFKRRLTVFFIISCLAICSSPVLAQQSDEGPSVQMEGVSPDGDGAASGYGNSAAGFGSDVENSGADQEEAGGEKADAPAADAGEDQVETEATSKDKAIAGPDAAQSSAAFSPSGSAPGTEVRGEVRKVDIPNADKSSGNLNYNVPIAVPAFRGLEPSIALNYSSGRKTRVGGLYQGWLGYGWGLVGFDVIERASPGSGLPAFNAADIFLINGSEMVACGSGVISPSCASGGTHATENESYRRIAFVSGTNEWKVTDANGTVSLFRSIAAIAGTNPSSGTPAGDLSRNARWLLSSVIDTHGNTVTYSYSCPDIGTTPLTAVCYPNTVTYNGTSLTFYYENRPDLILMANGRDISITKQRIKSIAVKVGTALRSAYALTYDQAPFSNASRLIKVEVYGTDGAVSSSGVVTGATKRRLAELTYQGATPTFIELPTSALPYPGGWASVSDQLAIVEDLNGDGKNELIGYSGTGANAQFHVVFNDNGTTTLRNASQVYDNTNMFRSIIGPNLGGWAPLVSGRFDPASRYKSYVGSNVEITESDYRPQGGYYSYEVDDPSCGVIQTNDPSGACYGHNPVWVPDPNDPGTPATLAGTKWRITNYNLKTAANLDYVRTECPDANGYFNSVCNKLPPEIDNQSLDYDGVMALWKKNFTLDLDGDGVDELHRWAVPGNFLDVTFGTIVRNFVGVVDLKGNGRQRMMTWQALLEPNGSGGWNNGLSNPADCPATRQSGLGGANNDYEKISCAIADVNGDGASDIVQFTFQYETDGQGNIEEPASRKLKIWLSTGNGFKALPQSIASSQYSIQGSPSFVDYDRDGKADLLYSREQDGLQGSIYPQTFKPRKFHSLRFTMTASPYFGTSYTNSWTEFAGVSIPFDSQVGELNGDGMLDYAEARMDISNFNNFPNVMKVRVFTTDVFSGAPHLLRNVTDELGATITVQYRPSGKMVNDYMPTIMQAVSKLFVNDGRGQSATTSYSYSGGKYDGAARKFLGYRSVTETLALSNGETSAPKIETTYRQDVASFGKPELIVYKDGAGVTRKQVTETYAVNTTAKPYWVQNIATEATLTEDASVTTRVERSFDDWGNLIELKDHGRIDVAGDETRTIWQFSPNTTAFITALAHTKEVRADFAPASPPEESSSTFFDGASTAATAPVKGDVTRQDVRVANAPAVVVATSTFTYDSYGNRISAGRSGRQPHGVGLRHDLQALSGGREVAALLR